MSVHAPTRTAQARLREAALEGREYLVDSLSVADLYLFTVLAWTAATPIDLAAYPALAEHHRRIGQRPSCVGARRALLAQRP